MPMIIHFNAEPLDLGVGLAWNVVLITPYLN